METIYKNSTLIAIDGTECSSEEEVNLVNEQFWNDAIINMPNPLNASIARGYFRTAYLEMSSELMFSEDLIKIYNTFILSREQGFLSNNLQKLFLINFYDAEVFYRSIEDKKQLLAIRNNMLEIAADLDATSKREI